MQCCVGNTNTNTLHMIQPPGITFQMLTHLAGIQVEKVPTLGPAIRLRAAQHLAHIFGHERSARHVAHRRRRPALGARLAHRQRHRLAALHDTIAAQQLVAAAHVATLENHRRIGIVEAPIQPALGVVPVLHRDFAALAAGRCATGMRKGQWSIFGSLMLSLSIQLTCQRMRKHASAQCADRSARRRCAAQSTA